MQASPGYHHRGHFVGSGTPQRGVRLGRRRKQGNETTALSQTTRSSSAPPASSRGGGNTHRPEEVCKRIIVRRNYNKVNGTVTTTITEESVQIGSSAAGSDRIFPASYSSSSSFSSSRRQRQSKQDTIWRLFCCVNETSTIRSLTDGLSKVQPQQSSSDADFRMHDYYQFDVVTDPKQAFRFLGMQRDDFYDVILVDVTTHISFFRTFLGTSGIYMFPLRACLAATTATQEKTNESSDSRKRRDQGILMSCAVDMVVHSMTELHHAIHAFWGPFLDGSARFDVPVSHNNMYGNADGKNLNGEELNKNFVNLQLKQTLASTNFSADHNLFSTAKRFKERIDTFLKLSQGFETIRIQRHQTYHSMLESLPERLSFWKEQSSSSTSGSSSTSAGSDQTVRFVHISDTHGMHRNIRLPPGDVLIHTGDIVSNHAKRPAIGSTEHQFQDFLDWLGEIQGQFRQIIFIAGNHDTFLDPLSAKRKDLASSSPGTNQHEVLRKDALRRIQSLQKRHPNKIHYLENQSYHWNGFHFYGTPITIDRVEQRGERKRTNGFERIARLRRGVYWKSIPPDVDVLLTHVPPQMKLGYTKPRRVNQPTKGITKSQYTVTNVRDSCPLLYEAVYDDGVAHQSNGDQSRANGNNNSDSNKKARRRGGRRPPLLHAFGHVHTLVGAAYYAPSSTILSNASQERVLRNDKVTGGMAMVLDLPTKTAAAASNNRSRNRSRRGKNSRQTERDNNDNDTKNKPVSSWLD